MFMQKFARKPFLLLCAIICFASWHTGLEGAQKVFQKKTITVGMTPEYRPLHYQSEGQWEGVEIEMLRSLCRFLGVECNIVERSLDRLVPELAAGKLDLVLSGLSVNLERAGEVWFSEPYLHTTPAVLIDSRKLPKTSYGEEFEGKAFRTIWDLSNVTGLTLAIKKGSSLGESLRKSLPGIELVLVADNEEGLALFKNGRVDGFVHDSLYLENYYARHRSAMRHVTLLSGGSVVDHLAIGLPFGNVVLKNQVDIWLSEIKRTGELERWMRQYMTDKDAQTPPGLEQFFRGDKQDKQPEKKERGVRR